ncbi:MAG: 16S rRNA (uracil(1498)-N(3))-methyltransferase [Enterococcus sp.]|nr:16S rRNA (uracil(1498)-N(3))-methyltransferase [Enterococcus sp.]
MSLHHYFLKDQILEKEAEEYFPLLLSSEDLRHARVQRLQVGEHISLIDAAGVYYECEIKSFDGHNLIVSIVGKSNVKTEKFSVSLAFANLKGDKNETIIKSCTELGVSQFFIFHSSRCVSHISREKASKKLSRYQKIAKSAAMQSGANFIASVDILKNFDVLCERLVNFDQVLIFWEEAELQNTLTCALKAARRKDKILLIIGPEGGFSPSDILKISKAGNKRVSELSLGPKILRSETACIASSATALELLRNSCT